MLTFVTDVTNLVNALLLRMRLYRGPGNAFDLTQYTYLYVNSLNGEQDLQPGSYFSVRTHNESGYCYTRKMPDSCVDTFINYREEGTNSSAAPVSQYWGRGFDSHHFDCASVRRSVI